jgi:putative ABC transport system substrate-binding protein
LRRLLLASDGNLVRGRGDEPALDRAPMSYGADGPASFRRSAVFVKRILQGEKPADMPVEQPTKFELVINLKTAKTLDLAVPPTLIFRADEVIE